MVHPSFLMNKFQTNYNPIIRYISNFRIKILQPLNQKLSSSLADFYLNLYFRRYNFTQLGTQCQRERYALDILHNFGYFVSLNFQSFKPAVHSSFSISPSLAFQPHGTIQDCRKCEKHFYIYRRWVDQ